MNRLITVPRTKMAKTVQVIEDGLNISSGAASKRTYYNSKEDQIAAIKHAISEMYAFDKSIPIVFAALKNSTDYFRTSVLENELSRGSTGGNTHVIDPERWFDDIQDNALWVVLAQMPVTYTLRLFVGLVDRRVSNARTRRIMLTYIWNLNEFAFVKYRSKIEKIFRHAYGTSTWAALQNVTGAIHSGVLTPDQLVLVNTRIRKYTENSDHSVDQAANVISFVTRRYDDINTDILDSSSFIKAYMKVQKTSSLNVFWSNAKKLDRTVVEGLVSSHSNPLYKEFFELVDGSKKLKESFKKELIASSKTMTDDTKVRLTKTMKAMGIDRGEINVENVSAAAIMKTGYETNERESDLITRKANLDKINLPYENIGIVIDLSLSNRGGSDSKNTPRASIDYMAEVLKASATKSYAFGSDVAGRTNLVNPFVNVLREHYEGDVPLDAIFILSDGYENHPYEGCLNDTIKLAQENDEGFPPVIHINPLVAAEMGALGRPLGDKLVTMVAQKPTQLEAQFNMSLLKLNPAQYLENMYVKLLPSEMTV